ncbi:membrane-associated protein, putative [Bodo saltans]|uniref:Membrane-associated protein, putative n=1 Tax=Bodo saltans TaxID=75058 RepID=A0A0S4IXM4_BODSA|nr:membrane-associated protein, putative [Bodo saltans]|eukprot:CUG43811.1 membrane-associated protein, putative [Bodo saltans]
MDKENGTENFYHPQRKMKKNMQRAGLRGGKKVAYIFIGCVLAFLGVPMLLGPMYENYVARIEWVRRAQNMAKNIWTRRNEKDWDLYMTQRKNSWSEILGFKRYNIGGDENTGDIQKYK